MYETVRIPGRQRAIKTPKGRLDILTYHAITDEPPPLKDWCFLPASSFAEQMRLLSRLRINVMSLWVAADQLAKGQLQGNCVAITFDDGYRNNITKALPILEQYGYPATIFLVSDLVGKKTALWPNRVIAAISETTCEMIQFREHTFDLSATEKKCWASRKLQELVKQESGENPGLAVEEIETACKTTIDPDFDVNHPFAVLDQAEIREVAGKGLIEFGGHSTSHPILSKLPDSRIEHEVGGSVRSIEAITGQACRTYAYPNGALADFDERSVESLKSTNVEYAVSTVQARNRRVDDPYRLSRWDIGSNTTPLKFAATLMGLSPSNFERQAARFNGLRMARRLANQAIRKMRS